MKETAIPEQGRRKPSVAFNVQRMETLFHKSEGKPDVPHRHDYFTILLVWNAKGRHVIDYQTFSFSGQEVHFISPGQLHQVVLEAPPDGWVMTFSDDFLLENNIPRNFISNINLFRAFGDSPPLSLDVDTTNRLRHIISEMEACMSQQLTYRSRALGALLQLFLIYCNNSSRLDSSQLDEEHPGVCILRDFKNLVEEKYMHWHKVGQYAVDIHISPKHLSQTVKNITGKSAKEIIQDRIMLEAKRLLQHTDMQVKEIAYHLGFEEPLHFSGFFKKQANVSPTDFRASHSDKPSL